MFIVLILLSLLFTSARSFAEPFPIPDIFAQAGLNTEDFEAAVVVAPDTKLGDTLVLSMPLAVMLQRRFPKLPIHFFSHWAHELSPRHAQLHYHSIPRGEFTIDRLFATNGIIDAAIGPIVDPTKRILVVGGPQRGRLRAERFSWVKHDTIRDFLARRRAIRMLSPGIGLSVFEFTGKSRNYVPDFAPLSWPQFFRATSYESLSGFSLQLFGLKASSDLPAVELLDERDLRLFAASSIEEPLPTSFVFFNLNTSEDRMYLRQNYSAVFVRMAKDICNVLRGTGRDLVVTRPVCQECNANVLMDQLAQVCGTRIRSITDRPKTESDYATLQYAMQHSDYMLTHDTGLGHMAAMLRRNRQDGMALSTFYTDLGRKGWKIPGVPHIAEVQPLLYRNVPYRRLLRQLGLAVNSSLVCDAAVANDD